MKILVIGDIFGHLGRKIIEKKIVQIKEEQEIDLIIANVENVTHGRGISKKHFEFLKKKGIEVMTSGNHVFDLEETREFIKNEPLLLRPANSNPYHPGEGTILLQRKGKTIRITNLLGTVFLSPAGSNPFLALEKIIEKDKEEKKK